MGQSDRNRKWEDGGLTELSYDGRPRRKTFGSVASLATGLTSAPTDMLYCFSGFVVLTQIFDVINFFSKWVSTINRQRHITNITCRYISGFRKGKLGM